MPKIDSFNAEQMDKLNSSFSKLSTQMFEGQLTQETLDKIIEMDPTEREKLFSKKTLTPEEARQRLYNLAPRATKLS